MTDTEQLTTVARVHIHLSSGFAFKTAEHRKERADDITQEVTAQMGTPDPHYRTIDFPSEDGWRTVSCRDIIATWQTSRQVRTAILDGGTA